MESCKFWHLPSNGIIAKIVLRDPVILLEDQTFFNCYISETVRTSTEMWESFVDFDICHRAVLLRKLYSVTLTYFLKVKNKVNISETVWANAEMRNTTFTDMDICQRMIPFRKLRQMTLIYLFKIKYLKFQHLGNSNSWRRHVKLL